MLLIIAILGILLNFYIRLGQVTSPDAICLGNFTGCEQLQTSPLSAVLFGIPNSLLGIIFFLVITIYTIYAIYSKKFDKIVHFVFIVLCTCASIFAIYLTIKQFQIKQFCPLCLVNAILALYTSFLVISKKFFPNFQDENVARYFVISILILCLIGFVGIGSFYNQISNKNSLQVYQNRQNTEIENILNLENQPFLGEADAKLTIIEFANPTCPYCKILHEESLKPLLQQYSNKIKYYYMNAYSHCRNSEDFFAILESCKALGKFFECVEVLYKNQDKYYSIDNQSGNCPIDFDRLTNILSQLQIDSKQFNNFYRGIDKQELAKSIRLSMSLLKVEATPTLFFLVGGEIFSVLGYRSIEDLKSLIDKFLQQK